MCQKQKRSPHNKKTTKQFQEEVWEKWGKGFEVKGEYLARDIRIDIYHDKCGEISPVIPCDFLKRGTCPACKAKKREQRPKKNISPDNYVEINHLPTYIHNKKEVIHWEQCVGYKVKCHYEGKTFEVMIKDVFFDNKNKKLNVLMPDGNRRNIEIQSFKKGRLKHLLKPLNREYLFQIGERIKTNTGEVEILDQTREGGHKAYFYQCLICGQTNSKQETELKNGGGCPVCAGKDILIGYNDLGTTAPWITDWLADPSDALKYTRSSEQKILTKCLFCGKEKPVRIGNLVRRGMGCSCCKTKSLPERFAKSLFSFLNLNHEEQYSPQWIGKERYDFYLNDLNLICEVHGLQHYKQQKGRKNVRTLEEEQANDAYKKEKALEAGLNYVVIDCRKSDLLFLIEQFKNSELIKWVSLDNVDWTWVCQDALDSIVKECASLFNQGLGTKEIAKEVGLSRSTVTQYLKRATQAKLCVYNPKEEHIKAIKGVGTPVRCVETNKVYPTRRECAIQMSNEFGIPFNSTLIGAVCRGEKKSHRGYHFQNAN